MKKYLLIYGLFAHLACFAQEYYGVVEECTFKQTIPCATVKLTTTSGKEYLTKTDEFGRFTFKEVSESSFSITIKSTYYNTLDTSFSDRKDLNLGVLKITNTKSLKPVDVYAISPFETGMMRTIEGVTITHGKKTQKINLEKIAANKSTNNPREIYAKVPGLTIWESDAGGLQLGIGARGLNPSRSAHINIRQNGYDISADPLGYPESYYTPPTQALKSINFIRGAASLQFGPQFGGMLNFVMKDPSKKAFSYNGEHTYGAYNLLTTYNEISGTLGQRFSYFGYGLYKQGDSWRENSEFDQTFGYGRITFAPTEKMTLSLEHTYMNYLARQAGGLTDGMFNIDPRQSIRNRNWFRVNWNISTFNWYWNISNKTTISLISSHVRAERDALGNLEKISRIDDLTERTLISGSFKNVSSELRLLKRYPIGKGVTGVLSTGIRYYRGYTTAKQGLGTDGYDANFTFNNPDNLEFSDYEFPSENIAGFAENIFRFSDKFSLSIGGRMEYINTLSEGSYRQRVLHPLTEELLLDTTIYENAGQSRIIYLFGMGATYKTKAGEIYSNIAQNYRAINFSDIRITNPNQRVDENITDESGFTADLGLRNQKDDIIFDVGAFFIYYNNKIGVVNTVDTVNFETIRFRTNVGLAYSSGIELFTEKKFTLNDSLKRGISLFGNFTFIYAKYADQEESAFSNKFIEQVPPITFRGGVKLNLKRHCFGITGSYVHKQYTDATNAEFDPNAVAGLIPSYYVLDFTGAYIPNSWWYLKYGVNNLTNNKYFTRRATGYPGPGIIPAEGIGFYLTFGLKF
ncbi:MAG: TonB-dependent receptor [Crocinitomicaceae bacterium]|nr:TonB-dependent receptor [Crocinitomicaceae bacterium]